MADDQHWLDAPEPPLEPPEDYLTPTRDPVCECDHPLDEHEPGEGPAYCHVPGCTCTDFAQAAR